LSVWHQGMTEATKHPALRHQLENHESELLPRFAEHYQQLKALRRRLRRSLQRQWKRSLAGVALLIALGQAPALAATIRALWDMRVGSWTHALGLQVAQQ
jgi:alkylhydroperoxidase/carboxymuconolactone decarboxylase family protein YurZ